MLFRALLWKEWHEFRWKMLALMAILLVPSLMGWLYDFSGSVVAFEMTLMFYLAGTLFVAMGVSAGERASGTLGFTQSLPVPLWQPALARLVAGAVACALPIILTTALLILGQLVRPVPPHERIWSSHDGAMNLLLIGLIWLVANVGLLLWSSAASVRQPTVLRAGLVGVVVTAAWLFSLPGAFEPMLFWIGSFGPAWGLLLVNKATADRLSVAAGFGVLFAQLAASLALVLWFIGRYGTDPMTRWTDLLRFFGPNLEAPAKPTPSASSVSAQAPVSAGLAPQGGRLTSQRQPRFCQLRALLRRQAHESWSISVVGVAIIWGVVLLAHLTSTRIAPPLTIFESLLTAVIYVGPLWAMVLGVGTFTDELHPSLHHFWRSRPISPSKWYWSKLLGNALLFTLLFEVPVAVLAAPGPPQTTVWNTMWTPIGYLATLWPLHLLFLALAVCMTCLVRQPIYAGILTVVAAVAILTTPELPHSRLRFLRVGVSQEVAWEFVRPWPDVIFAAFRNPHYLVWVGCVLTMTLTAAVVGWLAVKWDVGWKER